MLKNVVNNMLIVTFLFFVSLSYTVLSPPPTHAHLRSGGLLLMGGGGVIFVGECVNTF